MIFRLSGRAVCAAVAVSALACSSRPVTGAATVTIEHASAFTDAVVVFQRPDRATAQVVLPDMNGRATGEVVSGSSVTVGVYVPGYLWRLTTIAAVEPGDALRLADYADPPAITTQATVRLPGVAPGAAWYGIDSGCGGGNAGDPAGPAVLNLAAPPCGSTIDVLATAYDASANAIACAAALDVAYSDTTATLGPWHDLDAITLAVTNAPPGAYLADAWLEPRRRGLRYGGRYSESAVLAEGGGVSLSVRLAPEFATTARRSLRLYYSDDRSHPNGVALQVVNEEPVGSTTLDLATALLPRLRDVRIATEDGVRRATWTRSADDPSIDGQILWVRFAGSDGVHDWEVVLPPGETSFAFPALPSALNAHGPPVGATVTLLSVTAYDTSDAASYAEFKRAHLGLLRGLGESGSWTLRSSTSSPTP